MTDTPDSRNNPYPGLRPFQADETHLFFGRDEQRTELLGSLRKSRFLAVVGTSGSGKSSLVRAGLLPGLFGGFMAGGGSRWRIVDTRPGGNPIGRLATALDAQGALVDEDVEDDAFSFTEATLRRSSLGLTDVVKEARLPGNEKVLILVDQFEELFRFIDTAHTGKAREDAAAFVKLLLDAAGQSDVPIYVVITMRSDFLGDCARFRDLPEAINEGQYLIPRQTRDQRREAITGPASVYGASLSRTLVNRLLNDVGDVPDQLPILQHALMRTFDHWKVEHPDSDTINLEDYEEIGGMTEALSRHADSILQGLSENVDPEEGQKRQQIAENLFKCLTEEGDGGRDVRRLAKLQDIADVASADVGDVASIIDAFRQPSNSFLMPPIDEKLTPETYVDISHESLIRNWATLGQWVRDEAAAADIYKRLAHKAVLHRKGKEDLLGGQALGVANAWRARQQPTAAWAKRYDPAYETAMSYLTESEAVFRAAEDARSRRHKIKKTAFIGTALAILTPFLLLVHIKGLEAEGMTRQASIEAHLKNGYADLLLSIYYDSRFSDPSESDFFELEKTYFELENENEPVVDNSEKQSDFLNLLRDDRPGWVQGSNPYDYEIQNILQFYGATDHATIIENLNDNTWDGLLGEHLLNEISYAKPEAAERVLGAILETGVSRPRHTDDSNLNLKWLGRTLRDHLTTPEELLNQLHDAGLENDSFVITLQKNKDARFEADVLLHSLYKNIRLNRLLQDGNEIAQIIPEELETAGQYGPHRELADQALFTAHRNWLRHILRGPADQLEKRDTELRKIKEYFAAREIDVPKKHAEKLPKESSNGSEEESAKEFCKRLHDAEPQQEHTLHRICDYDSKQLDPLLGMRDFDSEQKSQIAAYLTAIALEKASEHGVEDSELEEVRDSRVAKYLNRSDEPRLFSTLFGTLLEGTTDSKYFDLVYKMSPVIGFVALWPCWSWRRRYRARHGKLTQAKVGAARLGLALLLDGFLAIVLGVAFGLLAAAVASLPLAAVFGSFETTQEVTYLTGSVIGVAVFVGYVLFRDAIEFRYRRSFGKILCELLPVSKSGRPINKRLSAKRNWIAPICVPLFLIVLSIPLYLTLGLLSFAFSSLLGAILSTAILIAMILAIIGKLDRLGDRFAKTKVIDTRSEEAAALDLHGDSALTQA